MDVKIRIRNAIGKVNPFAIRRRKRMRAALVNKTPSLLVPNCLGGTLFHALGLKFYSPMINLMMTQTEFVEMVCNLDDYMHRDLFFFKHPEYSCPCAKLGRDGVTVHFSHYENETIAREKWTVRRERINKNNLFIVAVERDGLTKEDMLRLGQLKAKGIVVFTAHEYPDIPYTCYVPSCSENGIVTGLLKRYYWDDHEKFEDLFDFVKWFNEADGAPYDISKFQKSH